MMDKGKRSVLGVLVNVIDLETAAQQALAAARDCRSLAVTALAVHGVMTGVSDPEQRYRLNHLDIVTPDGQPVRWALRLLHGARLKQRVYGPDLTLRLCQGAAQQHLPVYFYGSSEAVLQKLEQNLRQRFPDLSIVGLEPSRFRPLSPAERDQVIERIRQSGARIVFVGLGCPRQEVWAYEYRDRLNLPVLAVGAAFDFLSGNKPQAPKWMQSHGLEWLFRLSQEPSRLWRRYLLLNPVYLALLLLQWLGIRRFDINGQPPTSDLLYG
jgi:exopolysaccharide biosynthesis WecB/TagA/CpsF family protein